MPPQQDGPGDFRLGDWLVRPSLGRLIGPAGEVQLEPRAMEVLVYLAEHAEEVASRREIIDAVWRQEFVSDATLSGTIAKLRRAFGDDARSPRYIETLSKRGYRLLVRPTEEPDAVRRRDGGLREGVSGPAAVGGTSRTGAAAAVTQPSATVTTFPEVPAGLERPVFVGREAELVRLEGWLTSALDGAGRVAFISGEAGTGKTALLEELVRRAADTHQNLVAAVGVCSAHTGAGDAYAPWRQLLALLTGDVDASHASGTMLAGLGRRLWRAAPIATEAVLTSGRDLVGTLIPGVALLSRIRAAAPAGTSWLESLDELVQRKVSLPPDAALQQAAVFMQVVRVLGAIARRRPLLLVLEDLHWADAGSIAMLFHLGREVASHRILVLGSYRPTDVALGRGGERHPLEPVVAEFKGRQSQLIVELGEAGDRTFVDALIDSEPNRLDEPFRQGLYRQTAGHALFTVETLRSLQDQGLIRRNAEDRWVEAGELDWADLPARVEGVISARIERLSEPLRELLATASVEGEVFSAEVLSRIRGADVRQTIRVLSRELEARHRLVGARGVRALDGGRLSTFGFSHVLFQRFLYSTLNEVELVQLHQDVGTALETLYGDDTEEVAVRLAHHFETARDIPKAIHYLHQAGGQATRLTANEEAIGHLARALELLKTLPASPDRDRTELALQFALYGPRSAVWGWAAPEVKGAVERARELAERVGDHHQRAWVLYLIGSLYTTSGRIPEIEDVATRLGELAHAMNDEAFELMAGALMAFCTSYSGRSREGLAGWKAVIDQYDSDRHQWIAHPSGADPAVMGCGHIAWLMARMGYLDQSLDWVDRSLKLAQRVGHHLSTCHCLAMGFTCHALRGEFDQAARFVERTRELASEHGFLHWLLYCGVWQGFQHIVRGEYDVGMELIAEQMEAFRRIGVEFGIVHQLCLLSAGHLGCGRTTEAIALLDKALEVVDRQGPHFHESEVHRHRGDAFQAAGAPTKAERCYLRAVRIAREQDAKMFELQAATHLARMWQGQGRHDEARELLVPIYGWFTEGLDTAPLVETRALLDELDQTLDQNE